MAHQKNKSSSRVPPVRYTQFDPTKAFFTELSKNDRSKNQEISFPRYAGVSNDFEKGTNLILQLPWIHLSQHGIPRLGEYYETDNDREFIKLPLDPNVPESKELMDKLMALDDRVGGELKLGIIGKKNAKKLDYLPLVRTPEEKVVDSDDEESKETIKRLPYIKIKFDTEFQTHVMKTLVYRKNADPDVRPKREQVGIETMEEMAEFVPYLSKVRVIVMANKLWASGSLKKFGITLKCLQIEVEPREVNQSISDNAFLDDSDSDEETKAEPATATSTPITASKNTALDDSDSDSDDEPTVVTKEVKVVEEPVVEEPVVEEAAEASDSDSTDSDSDEAPPPKAKKSKRKTKVVSA
jgi:hypothetical protein